MKHTRQPARVLLTFIVCLASGCATTSGPYDTPSSESRDPLRAQELTLRAADLISTDPQKVEEMLRDALTADLFHGPAHNNLGVIYLKRNELYEAAHEFEWARKLMPGSPDPRMNLALTLEHAGRIDEAIEEYATALEVYPGHLPSMQALTRLQLRRSRADERTRDMLEEIALRGETSEWREWAQFQLTKEGRWSLAD